MRPLLPSDPNRVGRYRMLGRLGVGGMGRVFLGSGPDGRLVALKLVSEDWLEDAGFRDRFRGEVDSSRRVTGGYTASVIDADAEAAMPWLASEFVPGITLAEAVTQAGKLPEPAVLRLAAGLAAALDVIHRASLVHRDLKPTNILLTDEGPRVIDFGIARATDNPGGTGFTRTGRIVGTAGYMSPEQAEGKDVTPASDVFCLGAVLTMAGTGSGPFDGNSDPQTIYNIVHKEPKLEDLPPRCRELVARCLDKDPLQRPAPGAILESIGDLDPVRQPWPQEVHAVIARQRADVDGILATPQWTVKLARVVDRTRAFTRTAPDRPRRPAAEAVNGWYDAAENRFRKLISSRDPKAGATAPDDRKPDTVRDKIDSARRKIESSRDTPNPALIRARDVAIVIVGVLVGMFVTADLNIGSTIETDRNSLGIGDSELERALTHPGYFGAAAGFLVGGFAGAMVRWIVGNSAKRFSRIALAVAAAVGFLLGWLAEHEYLDVTLVSLGVMDDAVGNGDEAGLLVLGVIVSFIAMGCAMWVIGRAIMLLTLVAFVPTAALGASWAYLGVTGIVIGGWSIGLASVIGATVGGAVAARVVKAIHDRRPAPPPKARAW